MSKTEKTTRINLSKGILPWANVIFNLHENNQQNDAFKSEEFSEGIDEEINDEEGVLDHQH